MFYLYSLVLILAQQFQGISYHGAKGQLPPRDLDGITKLLCSTEVFRASVNSANSANIRCGTSLMMGVTANSGVVASPEELRELALALILCLHGILVNQHNDCQRANTHHMVCLEYLHKNAR